MIEPDDDLGRSIHQLGSWYEQEARANGSFERASSSLGSRAPQRRPQTTARRVVAPALGVLTLVVALVVVFTNWTGSLGAPPSTVPSVEQTSPVVTSTAVSGKASVPLPSAPTTPTPSQPKRSASRATSTSPQASSNSVPKTPSRTTDAALPPIAPTEETNAATQPSAEATTSTSEAVDSCITPVTSPTRTLNDALSTGVHPVPGVSDTAYVDGTVGTTSRLIVSQKMLHFGIRLPRDRDVVPGYTFVEMTDNSDLTRQVLAGLPTVTVDGGRRAPWGYKALTDSWNYPYFYVGDYNPGALTVTKYDAFLRTLPMVKLGFLVKNKASGETKTVHLCVQFKMEQFAP